MKKIYLSFLFLMLIGGNLKAEEQLYETIIDLNRAETIEQIEYTANRFEQIAKRDKGDWKGYYYAALAMVKIELMAEIDQVDWYAERASDYLKKAESISPNNDEIFCLKALIESGKIRVDVKKRGFRYVVLSNNYLKKALKINIDNPRVYYVKGMNTLNMPPLLGGGKTQALKLFENAKSIFENEVNECENTNPHWGEEKCNLIINKINNNGNQY